MANAETQRTLRGCLVQYGDKGVHRPLHAVARVLAQFHGNTDLAWYAGIATLQNADGSWRIEYEDDDVEDLRVVPPGRRLPCIKHFDGAYVLPPPQDCAGHGGARRTKKRKPRKRRTTRTHGPRRRTKASDIGSQADLPSQWQTPTIGLVHGTTSAARHGTLHTHVHTRVTITPWKPRMYTRG
jgi:hypothetical protein